MTLRRQRWATALGVLLALAGCSRSPDSSGSDCWCEGTQVVDPTLVAFLSRARSAHHIADQHEQRGDLSAAAQSLKTLLLAPRPGRGQPPVEIREALADTHARLADLMSRQGKHDEASKLVSEGLTLARQTSYFRGHLYEILGIVEERRSTSLTATGRTAEADKARHRAVSAFEKAIEIQDAVIRNAIGNSEAP